MATRNQMRLLLAAIPVAGAIAVAIVGQLGGAKGKDPGITNPSPTPGQSAVGSGNIVVSGDNNVVNPPQAPKPCRDKSHGVERYQRTFSVSRTSHWMGGGYDQDRWCSDVVRDLRGENPEGSFRVERHSEESKNTCAPFNCPQYQYTCAVEVQTDPLYNERLSSACK